MHALQIRHSSGAQHRRIRPLTGGTMQADTLSRILKGTSWVVLALMLLAIAYASAIAIKYWAGIGV